jgi:Recombinase
MTTRTYLAGRQLVIPDWPGTGHEGSWFMRGDLVTGRHSIGYGRASHNPKQGQGIQDSSDEQGRQYREFVRSWGTVNVGLHLDPSASAGITASKARENFAAAMEQVRTDPRVEIVWVMTSSRMSRGDIPFDELIATLAGHGTLLAIGDSIYNPASDIDRETKLFPMYANDRTSTFAPRLASRRGAQRALREGRPTHRPPYGLRRDRNQVPPWDVPDHGHPDGQPAPDSPAAVTWEIFTRLTAGDTASAIAADLEQRRVFTPYAAAGIASAKIAGDRRFAWTTAAVRHIAANPAYMGQRRSKGRVLDDVKAHIEPLITEAQFWPAQQALARRTGRASPARRSSPSMLAATALCGVCGTPLTTSSSEPRRDGTRPRVYTCRLRGHVSVGQGALDEYVSRKIIAWLADPEMGRQLAEASEDVTAEALAAQGEVARLQHQIDQLRELQEADPAGVSHAEVVRTISLLQREQQHAEQRARPPAIDPLLAAARGPDAGRRWDESGPQVQRSLVARIAEVTVHRGPVANGRCSLASRVGWRWKLVSPATGEPIGMPAGEPQPHVSARQARGDRIVAWLAGQDGPRTVAQMSTALGEHPSVVREAAADLVKAGRVTRRIGLSEHGGPNTAFYRAA